MTGATHRTGGVLSCLLGYMILESKGMLIADINPLLQLTVMYPFAMYGGTISDLDHHWDSAPSKDVVSYGINKVLHLTTGLRKKQNKLIEKKVIPSNAKNPLVGILDARHRSWQTHSDLFLLSALMLAIHLINGLSSTGDGLILRLVFTGLILGIISHLVLDMLTPEGIWCIFGMVLSKIFNVALPQKIHLVPKNSFFATDGKWEKIVNTIMWTVSVMLIIRFIYLMLPYRFAFAF